MNVEGEKQIECALNILCMHDLGLNLLLRLRQQ